MVIQYELCRSFSVIIAGAVVNDHIDTDFCTTNINGFGKESEF